MFMPGISGIIPGVNAVAVSAPAGIDPYFSSTVLLAGPDGLAGASSFLDESFAAHGSLTSPGITNDAQISSAVTLFGSPTMLFDSGGNDNFQFPDHADWTGGTQQRTIEGFVYLANGAALNNFMGQWRTDTSQRGWLVNYRGDLGTPTLNFLGSADGIASATIVGGAITIPSSTWYYFCCERAGSNVHRIYAGPLGGAAAMIDKQTNAIDIFNSNTFLMLSGTVNLSGNLGGNLGEVRITNGVARYNTDAGFPVPTAKFPRS